MEDQSVKSRAEISLLQVILSLAKLSLFIPAYHSGPKRKRDAVAEFAEQIHSCEIKNACQK